VITIYHNSRCRKSREAHQFLEESGLAFDVRYYLENALNIKEIEALLNKLEISPIDLIRTGETIWKQDFKGKQLSNSAIIEAMVQHPKLIERPILESSEFAIVGRPVDNVHKFLRKLRDN